MPTAKDEDVAVSERGAAVPSTAEAPVPEPYVDPYKQILNPLELPANPVAAANYPGDNVDPTAPISEERAAQAEAAIADEEARLQAVVPPEHPAHAEAPEEHQLTAKEQKAEDKQQRADEEKK